MHTNVAACKQMLLRVLHANVLLRGDRKIKRRPRFIIQIVISFMADLHCRSNALHTNRLPPWLRANAGAHLLEAAFITETRAACCTEEEHWGFVVTPIWPAMLCCDLPEPDAAAITCWRDECCAAALTFELFAAPRWPATCWRFMFD